MAYGNPHGGHEPPVIPRTIHPAGERGARRISGRSVVVGVYRIGTGDPVCGPRPARLEGGEGVTDVLIVAAEYRGAGPETRVATPDHSTG